MKIIGMDPGKKGGLSCLNTEDMSLEYIRTPLLENGDIDVSAIFSFVKKCEPNLVIHEKVHSVYGTSAKSNFSFGQGYGILQAICLVYGDVYNIPFMEVRPKAWQKVCWEGITKVKNPKKNSLVAAKRLFPNESFIPTKRSKKAHDGIVDATLIAFYGMCKFNK